MLKSPSALRLHKLAAFALASSSLLWGCRSQVDPRLQTTLQGNLNRPVVNSFSNQEPVFGDTETNIKRIVQKPYDGTIRFVIMGDNRNSTPWSSGGNKVYAKVIQQVNALQPDFAVNLGDFTFDSLRPHWKTFEELTSAAQAPYLTVVGNHDILFGRSYYETRYTQPHPETGLDDYSFDYGNSRFIMMDSANYNFTERQFAWMEKQFQTDKKKFVFSHTPPSVGPWEHKLAPSPEVGKRWMEMNEKYKVDHVFLGHVHLFDQQTFNGIDYTVSGGAGAPLDKNKGFGQGVYHVVMVEINGDQVNTQMVPIDTRIQTHGPTSYDGLRPVDQNGPRVLNQYPADFIPPEEQ